MGRTTIVCESTYSERGPQLNAVMGIAIASLGDIDEDGCDDVAVGAPQLRLPGSAQSQHGAVRIITGAGASCSTTRPRLTWLYGRTGHAKTGSVLNATQDLDGDGFRDVLISESSFSRFSGAAPVGRVILLSSQYIRNVLGDEEAPLISEFSIEGNENGEKFGNAITVVPTQSGAIFLAVGVQFATVDRIAQSGRGGSF